MRGSTWMIAVAGVAVAAVASGCGGRAAAQEAAPKAKKGPSAAKKAPAALPAAPRRPLADYDVIALRNPFSSQPVRKPAPPVKPAPKPVTPATPAKPPEREIVENLTLTAIFIPKEAGGAPSVLIEEEDAKPRSLKVGDTLLKGTISTIALDRIVVTIDQKPRTILVGESFADGTKTRIKGSAPVRRTPSSSSSASSASTPAGKPSNLLTEDERKLPLAERTKLMMKRMKERRAKERADKE